MSKKKVIIIVTICLLIIGTIFGLYIRKQKRIEAIDIQIYNIDFNFVTDIFCIQGIKYKNEKGKEVIKDYKINTKKLATKIYVYREKYGEFSDFNSFLENYKKDKYNFDKKSIELNALIREYPQDYLKEKEEIEQIEEWLKDGQIQKLEEWLNNQEF